MCPLIGVVVDTVERARAVTSLVLMRRRRQGARDAGKGVHRTGRLVMTGWSREWSQTRGCERLSRDTNTPPDLQTARPAGVEGNEWGRAATNTVGVQIPPPPPNVDGQPKSA